ncbi:MAG TPA: ATP-binding cassette domain-containing protein [Bradyrhizobium sp.]|jgi:ribose transport system ATP-binding protein|nr:ATP-binding cassette domain-containing protein [Bradyrhizobium sp.]
MKTPAAQPSVTAGGPLLEAVGLSKSFGPVEVLKDVSLAVNPGEVHAIIGENGAGKSTLMKLLAGHLQPTRGELRIDGETVTLTGPVDAERRGIVLVHQEILLAPDLTVAQNVYLGRELPKGILGIPRHVGLPICTRWRETSPVQPVMDWNGSLNLSSS